MRVECYDWDRDGGWETHKFCNQLNTKESVDRWKLRRDISSLVYYRVAQFSWTRSSSGIPAVHPHPKISVVHPHPPIPSYPGLREKILYETNLNLKKPYKFLSTFFCPKSIYLSVNRRFHRTFALPYYTFLFVLSQLSTSFCRHDLIGVFSTTINELKSTPGITYEARFLQWTFGRV